MITTQQEVFLLAIEGVIDVAGEKLDPAAFLSLLYQLTWHIEGTIKTAEAKSTKHF